LVFNSDLVLPLNATDNNNGNAYANLDQGFVGAVAQRLVSALLAAAKVHGLAFGGVIFHGCEA
jgi:hypothetical protein